MGTLTLSELRGEITTALANRDDLPSSRINTVLNLAQERIARLHDFEELRVTETRNLSFTSDPAVDRFLPFSSLANPDPKEIYSFRVMDGLQSRKLIRVLPRQFDKLVPSTEAISVSTPTHYVEWDDRFEFYPIVDQVYQANIRMSLWPLALTGDGQKSDFNRKDELLIHLSVMWFYESLGEYDRADRRWKIFENIIEETLDEDTTKPDLDIRPSFEMRAAVERDYWRNPFVSDI